MLEEEKGIFNGNASCRFVYVEHGKMKDEVKITVNGKEYIYKKTNVIPFMKTKGTVITVMVRIKDEAKEV